MILTVACPSAVLDDANALAAALASSVADLATFRGLSWQDAGGNRYAAASFDASPEWLTGAQAALTRPAWDTDRRVNITGASRAQAALVLWVVGGTGKPPQASPTALTVIGGVVGLDALAAMGLTPVQEAEQE